MTSRKSALLQAVAVGLAACFLFVLLAGLNLDKQGLYQDEVFQAAGSFAYLGGPATGAMIAWGVPILNNSYLGAIKTGIYGLYLRLAGNGFSVVSWRALSVGFVATGILLFALLSRKTLKPLFALVGLVLLCTDGTIILTSRHDWGPTSLALLLRLAIIGLLLHTGADYRGVRRDHLLLGVAFGLAVFEKLSSVVLIAPIGLALLLQPWRRKRPVLAALAAGAVLGSLPLIAVNATSYLRERTFISLSGTTGETRAPFAAYVKGFPERFLPLAAAEHPRWQILGEHATELEAGLAMILMAALIVTTLGVALWNFRQGPEFPAAAVLVLSVFGIAILLYLLPRHTAIHHEVQVIPFHYMAAVVALGGLVRLRPQWRLRHRLAAGILAGNLVLVGAQHVVTVSRIEAELRTKESGASWERAVTTIGEFANARRTQAVFIATDWGVATAIQCLTQNEPEVVHEVFWNYQGPADLERIVESSGRKTVYLVSPVFIAAAPAVSARINRDAGTIPGWREMPVEPEAAVLRPRIVVRRFEIQPSAPSVSSSPGPIAR